MSAKKHGSPPSRFVTARTFASAVGISEITAWRWMARNQVRTEQVGPVRYILATEIDRHLAAAEAAKRNVPKGRRNKG